ncbi:solute carrier family 22 member 21-like isoform X3 [Crassostrea angulata]|uniref:solute carrier family 22 member 21-like isoform X3 n=1 Tax=Magallana angulata TaxID=2784310 RepID=UPI0022B0C826|nr:solute carrier family 22 member 21-like isoform X3 [Crassostrea angulata]
MEQNLDVDEIWRALKPWGRYQIRQLSFMWVAILLTALHLLVVVFNGYTPQFQCAEISPTNHNSSINSTYDVTYDECSVTISYNQSNSSHTTTSCLNGYKYNAHDDISSFVTEGLLLSSVTLCVETLPMEWRFVAEVTGVVSWTTGIVMLTPLSYIMQTFSWRYLELLLALLSVYSLVEYWLFDESLRWLMANGRLGEAEKVVRKAAKMNKMSFDQVIGIVKAKMREMEALDKENGAILVASDSDAVIETYIPKNTEVKKYSMIDILRDRLILINSIVIWFVWVTNSLTYTGLNLITPTLYGNRFVNFFLLGAIEYLSALTEFLLINRIGRKKTLIILMGIAGASLLISTLISSLQGDNSALGYLATFFVLMGKYGITGAFSSVFLFTSELYPTNLRNSGYGFACAFASIGGVLAPFANTFHRYVAWGPGVVFSIMCFLSAIMTFYLPETRGRELPTSIEELKMWYKEHSGIQTSGTKQNKDFVEPKMN